MTYTKFGVPIGVIPTGADSRRIRQYLAPMRHVLGTLAAVDVFYNGRKTLDYHRLVDQRGQPLLS